MEVLIVLETVELLMHLEKEHIAHILHNSLKLRLSLSIEVFALIDLRLRLPLLSIECLRF